MRILRQQAGLSLRRVEAATGRGRGVLSQIENGKARANRDLVEWYDGRMGGDGLLVSIYAEARSAHGSHSTSRDSRRRVVAGDAVTVGAPTLPLGAMVPVGASDLVAGWTLTNSGSVAWTDRRVRRVGAHAAARLISSGPDVELAACRPGERIDLRIHFGVPDLAGTFAAYWQIVDSEGFACYEASDALAVTVVSV